MKVIMRVKPTPDELKKFTVRQLLEALYDLQVRFEHSTEPILGIVASSLLVTKELRERKVPDAVILEAAEQGKFPEE